MTEGFQRQQLLIIRQIVKDQQSKIPNLLELGSTVCQKGFPAKLLNLGDRTLSEMTDSGTSSAAKRWETAWVGLPGHGSDRPNPCLSDSDRLSRQRVHLA